jgi:ATP-dependent Clp endopeptidase proteolytic subunit ClpP
MQPFEIWLYDNVGEWGISSNTILEQVKEAGDAPIDLHINSPGGGVFEGYTIFNILAAHKPGVTVYIDGLAASMAAYIAMVGRPIKMASNAMLMIHNPTGSGDGDAQKMRKSADLLDKVTTSFAQAFINRGMLTADQVAQMMDEETWFTADMALAANLVDEIMPAMQMAAHFDLSRFKHAPSFDTVGKNMDSKTDAVAGIVDPGSTTTTLKPTSEEPGSTIPATVPPDTTVFDKLKGLLKPKAEMAAEITGLKTQIEVRDSSIAQLNAKIVEQQKTIEGFQTVASLVVELQSELEKMEKEQKTVEAAAIDKVAALGFPAKELPAQVSDDKKVGTPEGRSSEEILKEMNAITDATAQTKFYRAHEQEIKAAIQRERAAKQAATLTVNR